MRYSLCDHWEFVPVWSDSFAAGEGKGEPVRLPHTVREVPQHYVSPADYEMVSGYRCRLDVPESDRGKRLFLQFDGAAHIATVFVNGRELMTHSCGYTAFRVEITEEVAYGRENLVAVRLDSTENSAVPPFGFVIDYLTYGGLYREAWLDVRERSFLEDVYVTTPTLEDAQVVLTVQNPAGCTAVLELMDGQNRVVLTQGAKLSGKNKLHLAGARAWSVDDPYRYTCRATLYAGEKEILDVCEVKFGFRTAKFRADGFYLNGKKVFLRGLNRHQAYPYMGYAAPESLQREDARILKEELCCTAVRTSHYPQSQYFIDECDRLGLLVFTEIPGWQHIGDMSWQDQACQNTREMVLQYRNHPSIVLWGVRINESQDNDDLYRRTNAIARELDPSRATSGVRYLQHSSLLEDVYAFNDFSHTGDNPGVRRKKDVMDRSDKALLVTEHNGHMFPTKSFDPWARRQEHALRHIRVQNDAAASGEHTGCFGWCMFDYPTHKDFGSGDRVCYHGVMDAFRNPKLAAYAYASQGDTVPVLEMGSPMDIGDYDAGQLDTVYVFTNADTVELFKDGKFVTTLTPGPWKALPHGPLRLDDTIGSLLETEEHMAPDQARIIRECLLAIGKYGLEKLPLSVKVKIGYCMKKFHMTMDDAQRLYGKYIGGWGSAAITWRLDAKKDGKTVRSLIRRSGTALHLEVTASKTGLTEAQSYDAAAVRVRILDEYGNLAPYAQLPVRLSLEGPARLIGPDVVTAEGGMCGTYVRTSGESGTARLTLSTAQTAPVTVEFRIIAK